MRSRILGAAGLAAALVASPALAQMMVNATEPGLIEQIASAHGTTDLRYNVIDEPEITVTNPQGRSYLIDFHGCKGTPDGCTLLAITAEFDASPGLEALNRFNADYFYTRAFARADGKTVLEMDITLISKVSTDWLSETLGVWDQVLNIFADQVE
jgi:hypothetical protein